jgi:RNA polymerase sigma-70 factor (ECF subfamily)
MDLKTQPRQSQGLPFHIVAEALRHGDETAWQELLSRYSKRLVALARSRLFDGRLRQKVDAEDLVQSVFRTFLRHHQRNAFELKSWEAVWGLLLLLTVRRARRWHQHFTALKRDVGREESAPQTQPMEAEDESGSATRLIDPEPTPQEMASLLETIEEKLGSLTDGDRSVIRLGLLGYEDAEIALKAGKTEYRVGLARKEFLQELQNLLRQGARCDTTEA